MSLISIIIPIYKVEPYLRRCVDSVLAQTYTDLEIILVDDGSPDNCGAICDEYAAKDPRIKVIHKQNGGLSDARNAGLDIMTGRYVGFVDSDDWIEPQMYERLMELMTQYDADMAFGGVADDVVENGTVRTVKTSDYGTTPLAEDKLSAMKRYFHGSWSAWDKLYKALLFHEIRYPVGEINEDEAIVLQLLEQCQRICYTNEVFYHYIRRWDGSSITTTPFSPKDLAWKNHCAQNLKHVQEKHPELEMDAASRYLSSLLWHLTKVSLVQDRSLFQNEINELMTELRSQKALFDRTPLPDFNSKVRYFIAVHFGFNIYKTVFDLFRRIFK